MQDSDNTSNTKLSLAVMNQEGIVSSCWEAEEAAEAASGAQVTAWWAGWSTFLAPNSTSVARRSMFYRSALWLASVVCQ